MSKVENCYCTVRSKVIEEINDYYDRTKKPRYSDLYHPVFAAHSKTDKAAHFSGSILVAREGKPILNKGYGMTNYELGVPNTPKTVFCIASLTKAFTAAAIMQLQERGKLGVTSL